MTQTPRPVKMMGIIRSRMIQRYRSLVNGPMMRLYSASKGTSLMMKIKIMATARASRMEAAPRTISNFRFLCMDDPPYLLGGLTLEAKHVFAHLLVGQGRGVLKVGDDLAAAEYHQAVGKLHHLVEVGGD